MIAEDYRDGAQGWVEPFAKPIIFADCDCCVSLVQLILHAILPVGPEVDVSFDVFVDTFKDGQSVGVRAEVFELAFGIHMAAKHAGCVRLSFADGGETDAYFDGAGAVMFNHFGGNQFFECLFGFLQISSGVAYWPGEMGSAAVVEERILKELPADMMAALNPTVVRSGAQLMTIISR